VDDYPRVFEVCIINQTKGVSEPDKVFECAVEMGRNRSAFKKGSLVKKGTVKDVDEIANGGSDKPTNLGLCSRRVYESLLNSLNCDMRVKRCRLRVPTWEQSVPEWRQLIVSG
jgi:hypothetical protein